MRHLFCFFLLSFFWCLSHCVFIFRTFGADTRLIHFNPAPFPATPNVSPPGEEPRHPSSPVALPPAPLGDEMTRDDARLKASSSAGIRALLERTWAQTRAHTRVQFCRENRCCCLKFSFFHPCASMLAASFLFLGLFLFF